MQVNGQSESELCSTFLDEWAKSIIADPITKEKRSPQHFECENGVIDARIFLPNSYGFSGWTVGQSSYELWETNALGYKQNEYLAEIERDRPTYEKFRMDGNILDVGGGVGTVREFLNAEVNFLSIDPFINAPFGVPDQKRSAYRCLDRKLNFISGMAEFLPVQSGTFDWVHMRSMLDHVQVPDLAIMEASRVLRPGGRLLVGLFVVSPVSKLSTAWAKDRIKAGLTVLGVKRFKDYHTWHPTYANLKKLIETHGFAISQVFWQSGWKDQVVYIEAVKPVSAAQRSRQERMFK